MAFVSLLMMRWQCSPFVCETVEAADVCVLVGPIFNDYTTVGYSTLLTEAKMITIKGHQVDILGKRRFHGVKMCDVLGALAERLTKNDQSMVNFQRMFVPTGAPPNLGKGGNLTTNVLMHHIQETIKSQGDWAICAETGDSWFNGQKLRLPVGCLYEFQVRRLAHPSLHHSVHLLTHSLSFLFLSVCVCLRWEMQMQYGSIG